MSGCTKQSGRSESAKLASRIYRQVGKPDGLDAEVLARGYLELESERDALRKKHRAFLQHLIDAEKYDAKFGLTLPGDSALAALINSAMETLERPE